MSSAQRQNVRTVRTSEPAGSSASVLAAHIARLRMTRLVLAWPCPLNRVRTYILYVGRFSTAPAMQKLIDF